MKKLLVVSFLGLLLCQTPVNAEVQIPAKLTAESCKMEVLPLVIRDLPLKFVSKVNERIAIIPPKDLALIKEATTAEVDKITSDSVSEDGQQVSCHARVIYVLHDIDDRSEVERLEIDDIHYVLRRLPDGSDITIALDKDSAINSAAAILAGAKSHLEDWHEQLANTTV